MFSLYLSFTKSNTKIPQKVNENHLVIPHFDRFQQIETCTFCSFLTEKEKGNKYVGYNFGSKCYSNSLRLERPFSLAVTSKICGIKIIAFMP